jgi:hypothetical protein
MVKNQFGYQREKLWQARRALMAPHQNGEEHGFASAFIAFQHAFRQFDLSRIDDENPLRWIKTMRRLMSCEGLSDSTGEGTLVVRARMMTLDEKIEFSKAVDELASWFDTQHFSDR